MNDKQLFKGEKEIRINGQLIDGAARLQALKMRASIAGKAAFFNATRVDHSKSKLVRTTNVGRNAKCPCGSGLKYKQCCLKKIRQEEIAEKRFYREILNPEVRESVERGLKQAAEGQYSPDVDKDAA